MTDEPEHSGLPTRAIHEAYLDMQNAFREYRRAKDNGNKDVIDRSHGSVQESVLTFYELLRPHIKENDAIKDYWAGEPPSYPNNGGTPDPEDGKGVLQVQERVETVKLDDLDTDEFEDMELKDWHDELGLNGRVRVVGISGLGDKAFVKFHSYQFGLRNLDDWETKYQTAKEPVGGFMGGKTHTVERRARIDIERLKRAARELSSVAAQLGALSEFNASTPRTEITPELIEEVNEWREKTLE